MTKKDARRDHKEDARRQKDAVAQGERRKANARRAVVAVLLVALVAGGVLMLTRQREDANTASASPGAPASAGASAAPTDTATLLAQAAEAAKAAGCDAPTNVGAFDPSDKDGSHDGLAPLADYPSTPPSSGPHVDSTVSAGTYDAPVDLGAAIHSLEHGGVEIWYSPREANSPELARIESFVRDNLDHVVVAPYDYPDEGTLGQLPAGTGMVLTAWHYRQSCRDLSLPVVADFMSKYRTPPLADHDYLGEAPEPNVPI
jgi:hypothetical protein